MKKEMSTRYLEKLMQYKRNFNNRKNGRGRRVQFITLEDGRVKKIVHTPQTGSNKGYKKIKALHMLSIPTLSHSERAVGLTILYPEQEKKIREALKNSKR